MELPHLLNKETAVIDPRLVPKPQLESHHCTCRDINYPCAANDVAPPSAGGQANVADDQFACGLLLYHSPNCPRLVDTVFRKDLHAALHCYIHHYHCIIGYYRPLILQQQEYYNEHTRKFHFHGLQRLALHENSLNEHLLETMKRTLHDVANNLWDDFGMIWGAGVRYDHNDHGELMSVRLHVRSAPGYENKNYNVNELALYHIKYGCAVCLPEARRVRQRLLKQIAQMPDYHSAQARQVLAGMNIIL